MRKQNTVNRRVAQEYRVWLRENPDASKALKIAAFNRIADKHYRQAEAEAVA